MASLYITEYDGNITGDSQVPREPVVTEQKITITGVSAQSAAFNASTRLIRIHTDAICSILVGENPTATAAKQRLPADTIQFARVQPGHKIAVISNT